MGIFFCYADTCITNGQRLNTSSASVALKNNTLSLPKSTTASNPVHPPVFYNNYSHLKPTAPSRLHSPPYPCQLPSRRTPSAISATNPTIFHNEFRLPCYAATFSVPGESDPCTYNSCVEFSVFSCLSATQRAEYRPKCGLCRKPFLTFVKLRVTLEGSSPEWLRACATNALELDAADSTIVRAVRKLNAFLILQPENEARKHRSILI